MKRNFDLIRKILLEMEEAEEMKWGEDFRYEGFSDAEIYEHVELLIEAKILEGKVTKAVNGKNVSSVNRLTWVGYDYAGAMSDDEIWEKARETLLSDKRSVSFDILFDWLNHENKIRLGLIKN